MKLVRCPETVLEDLHQYDLEPAVEIVHTLFNSPDIIAVKKTISTMMDLV